MLYTMNMMSLHLLGYAFMLRLAISVYSMVQGCHKKPVAHKKLNIHIRYFHTIKFCQQNKI
jgi:hypothetical protein